MLELDKTGLEAAKTAYRIAEEHPEMTACTRCAGKGYVHGFGEYGYDPDWCPSCGGSGFELVEGEEGRPLREAISAYLSSASAVLSKRQPETGLEAATVVVPAKMHLSQEAIANLVFQCGGTEDGDPEERWCDGVMWVGNLADDDGGEPVHGLHVYSTEYPEDGSVTLAEFPAASSTSAGVTEEQVEAVIYAFDGDRSYGIGELDQLRRKMRAALEASRVDAPSRVTDYWHSVDTAPEDEWVILATSGEHVGQALMLVDEDTGRQAWSWYGGDPVHPNLKPLGWRHMPSPISSEILPMGPRAHLQPMERPSWQQVNGPLLRSHMPLKTASGISPCPPSVLSLKRCGSEYT